MFLRNTPAVKDGLLKRKRIYAKQFLATRARKFPKNSFHGSFSQFHLFLAPLLKYTAFRLIQSGLVLNVLHTHVFCNLFYHLLQKILKGYIQSNLMLIQLLRSLSFQISACFVFCFCMLSCFVTISHSGSQNMIVL